LYDLTFQKDRFASWQNRAKKTGSPDIYREWPEIGVHPFRRTDRPRWRPVCRFEDIVTLWQVTIML